MPNLVPLLRLVSDSGTQILWCEACVRQGMEPSEFWLHEQENLKDWSDHLRGTPWKILDWVKRPNDGRDCAECSRYNDQRCESCDGKGAMTAIANGGSHDTSPEYKSVECPDCDGKGVDIRE